MNPRGHESDPMAFMRPRGHPKNIPSPHADFHQVFFGRVVRFLPPEPLPAIACSCDWDAARTAQPNARRPLPAMYSAACSATCSASLGAPVICFDQIPCE